MIQRIQLRRGTAAQWTSANPILASGEQGLETDTRKTKIGDGSTAWNALSYETPTTESVLALLAGEIIYFEGIEVQDTEGSSIVPSEVTNATFTQKSGIPYLDRAAGSAQLLSNPPELLTKRIIINESLDAVANGLKKIVVTTFTIPAAKFAELSVFTIAINGTCAAYTPDIVINPSTIKLFFRKVGAADSSGSSAVVALAKSFGIINGAAVFEVAHSGGEVYVLPLGTVDAIASVGGFSLSTRTHAGVISSSMSDLTESTSAAWMLDSAIADTTMELVLEFTVTSKTTSYTGDRFMAALDITFIP